VNCAFRQLHTICNVGQPRALGRGIADRAENSYGAIESLIAGKSWFQIETLVPIQ
jgi:hypothetical protein